MISKQLTTVPASVREHNKNISVELERAILKMVAKEQEVLPESTLELRQAIAYELGWSESQESSSSILSGGNLVAPFIAREMELKCLEAFLDRNLRAQAPRRLETQEGAYTQSILFVDGLSRRGKFEEAVACGRESVALVEAMLTRSVAMQELGRALIQASKYEEAETTLGKSLNFLKTDMFYFDFAVQNFSLYPEAIIGPHWSQGPKCVPGAKRKKASRQV